MCTESIKSAAVSEVETEPVLAQHRIPSAATTKSSANYPVPRSCLGCKSKKIRCDKRKPCAACARAGRRCEFPPSGPRVRRSKKTIIADMSSRLADLEKTLTDPRGSRSVTASPQDDQNLATSSRLQNALYSGPPSNGPRGDVLVQKGSASQYFNEILISRVITDVRRRNLPPPRSVVYIIK